MTQSLAAPLQVRHDVEPELILILRDVNRTRVDRLSGGSLRRCEHPSELAFVDYLVARLLARLPCLRRGQPTKRGH